MEAYQNRSDALVSEIVRCPVSQQALRPMTRAELTRLNESIGTGGSLRQQDGSIVNRPLSAALITEDSGFAYRVDEGIYCLLSDHAIPLDGFDASSSLSEQRPRSSFADSKKAQVQAFYDEVGWQQVDGVYVDTAMFASKGDAIETYLERSWQRIRRSLPARGEFFLDVASGPRPVAMRDDFGRSFAHHVCVDVSIVALKDARENLGERGIYILGDITNLPLRTSSMDATVSLHTIYHVPKDEQATAFRELHRVLKPGGRATVAYMWGKHAPLPHLPTLPISLFRMARKRIARARGGGAPGPESLYFYGHSYQWFTRQDWPFEYEIRVLRFPNRHFLNVYIHRWLGGKQFLELLSELEERFPGVAGRFGCYPLIVIEKRSPA